MYAIIKQFCISRGPCNVLDIIDIDKPNEYMIKIEAEKLPEGNIRTREPKSTIICAHNLPFNYREMKQIASEFVVLYRTDLGEFFSIECNKGKAFLKVLNIEKAKKLFDELPQ